MADFELAIADILYKTCRRTGQLTLIALFHFRNILDYYVYSC